MPIRPLSFGIFPVPSAQDHAQLVDQVLAAERLGLDVVGIQDHPYQRRFLDTFSLIADLLARTSRITIFPDVANLPLRGPVMMAKAAASLDVMSGGRFELGLGAGTFWDAVVGMGGPRRAPGESLEAMEEAIHILRGVFDGERVVRGPGPHYPVPGYPAGPPPAHRIEIWIGSYGPRALGIIGRLGDGWVPSLAYMGPDRYDEARRRLDDAALAAGRQPTDIRRLYNIGGQITDGERGDGPLDGPVEHWIETLAGWAELLAVDTFVFSPPGSGTRGIERFAREIVPEVRAATGR
ncbi:MAG TPA: LLM class flavin-dependent oxidoreductase [Candidatus Limnocylindria bacterium]|nr:LLM class flavin-dependent oxidoreductase [Candidatus Limnocylindria bacterium]